MAPGLFFEALKRDVAGAQRSGTPLSILTFALDPSLHTTASQFQVALIELAFRISDQIRSEELFARVSDTGFWVVLKGTPADCEKFLERLEPRTIAGLKYLIFGRSSESYEELIDVIDSSYF